MIFGYPQIKKHEVIINNTYDFLAFQPTYYIYVRTSLATILSQPILLKKTAIVNIKNDIIP